MRPSYTMTFRFGTHGTIILCMLRCMKMTLKIIASKEEEKEMMKHKFKLNA